MYWSFSLVWSFQHLMVEPSHVKNSIPFSQFLRLCRLCSDDSDLFYKSESMCQFFENVVTLFLSFKRVTAARNLLIDSHHYKRHKKTYSDRIKFTLTFHPHNHSVKSIILKNFKLLQSDPETSTIFSQPPLISFKRDKNIGNSLVRSSFKTNHQPGTFNVLAYDTKLVLSFTMPTKYRDPSNPPRSLITSRAPPPTSSIA